jgi:hypothetical protein
MEPPWFDPGWGSGDGDGRSKCGAPVVGNLRYRLGCASDPQVVDFNYKSGLLQFLTSS